MPTNEPLTLNSYFLDDPLSDAEIQEITKLTGLSPAPVRVPHIFPTPTLDAQGHPQMPEGWEEAPLAMLRATGILRDVGRRVFLVSPKEIHWGTRFAEAIARLTGRYPYLIQTTRQLEANGIDDTLRVIDLDGAMQ